MDTEQTLIVDFLKQHKDSWSDSKRLHSLLADCIPEKKAMRFILQTAYDEGIYDELIEAEDKNRILYKYKKILIDDYAIDNDFALWVVETWNIIAVACNENKSKEEVQVDHDCVDDKIFQRMKIGLIKMANDVCNGHLTNRELGERLVRAIDEELSKSKG